MHVTFYTQYYPPEMGAPAARISDFARGLAARGCKVDVVTAMPNYPTGRVFPGYEGKRFCCELVDGIAVRRAPIHPDGSDKLTKRLRAALSFAASSIPLCASGKRREGVVVVESPPLTLPPAALASALWSRRPVVVNVSDLWPSSLVEMGVLRNRLLTKLAFLIEAKCYKTARMVTAQAPDIVTNIRSRFPAVDVRLLSNGVDTQAFRPDLRDELSRRELGASPDDVLVVYAGLHGLAQGLEAVIRAAQLVSSRPHIRFALVGDGPTKATLIDTVERMHLRNVKFVAPVQRNHLSKLLASADIGLVTLAHPLLGAVPSKIYEAMASGLTVVAATGGTAESIVTEWRTGICVQPGNADQIASAITQLSEDHQLRASCGKAGRTVACQVYDRSIWVDRLLDYLNDACR